MKSLDKGWKYKYFDNYAKAIDKIQSYGITVNGCFVLGFDTDTKETFKETEEFIKASNLSEVQITILTAFPKTELYNQLKRENRLIFENYWEKCTLFDVTFVPKNFTVKELENEFVELMINIYAEDVVKERKKRFKQTLLNRRKLNIH